MIRFILCINVLSAFISYYGASQNIDKNILTRYASESYAGTEYFISFPPGYEVKPTDPNNVFRLYIFSRVSQYVVVEVPGKKFIDSVQVTAGSTSFFAVPSGIGQPYRKGITEKSPAEKVYPKAGIHIKSRAPIVVYALNGFNGSSEGFVALPIERLGTDYVVEAWGQYADLDKGYKLPSRANIVAAYDKTKVTFTMGGNLGAKTSGGMIAEESKTWLLNAGDVVCIANDDNEQDISGSRISADKPVAVISGNECAVIPKDTTGCDYTCDMEIPANLWGKEYIVTPIVNRQNNPMIRVFAHPKYKNVQVYRDGSPWFVLPNYNGTEGHSYVEMRSTTGGLKATAISADAPISVMLYNTSGSEDNTGFAPFQFAVTPTEQFRKEVTFFCPPGTNGPKGEGANVSIVYALDSNGSVPKDLEYGIVSGNGEVLTWMPFKEKFGFDIGFRLPKKSINGGQYAVKNIKLPQSIAYSIRAKKTIAVYVYTKHDNDSYGLAAGGQLNDFTDTDAIPPTIVVSDSSSYHWAGTVYDSTSEKKGSIVNIYDIFLYRENTTFEHFIVNTEDVARTEKWKVKVLDSTKKARCVIVATDKKGNIGYREFVYKVDTAKVIIKAPQNLSLNISNEKNVQKYITVKNTNKVLTVMITKFSFSGTYFSIDDKNIKNSIIKPGDSLLIPINFFSQVKGKFTAKFTCTTDLLGTVETIITAKALESILTTTGDISFGESEVGEINNKDEKLGLMAADAEYTDATTIKKVRCNPENSIAFSSGSFGEQGFSIDTSLFVNKELVPGQPALEVPVSFKAQRVGVHSASLLLYTNDTKFEEVHLSGSGISISGIDEENNTRIIDVISDGIVLTINSKKQGNVKYILYNSVGENILIGETRGGGETHTISLQNVSVGMYILSVEMDGEKEFRKVIITK